MSTQPQTNRIKIANPPVEDEVNAYMTTDTAATATALPVISTTGFPIGGADDYYVLVGLYGEDKAEIKLVDQSASSASSFTTAALDYSHGASDIVTFARYNQIQLFGASSSGGTKTLIATFDIDVTEDFTEYTYEGTDYAFFYTAYYNEKDDEISAYSEEITSTSFSNNSAKRIITSGVLKAITKIDETGMGELTWDNCLLLLQDGLDEIMSVKRTWQFLHKISTGTSTVANVEYIAKPTDLAYLDFIIVDNNKLDFISRTEFNRLTENRNVVTTGTPYQYTEKNNKYYLYPTPSGAYDIEYEYFSDPTVVASLATEISTEFVPALIYYVASQAALIRGNDKRGDKMYALFEKKLEDQRIEFTGPWQGGDSETADVQSAINDF